MGRGQGPRPASHKSLEQYRTKYAETLKLLATNNEDVKLVASLLKVSIQTIYNRLKRCQVKSALVYKQL